MIESFSSISSSSSENRRSEKYTGVRINQKFQEVLRSECQEPLSSLSMLDLNLLAERFYDMVSDGLIIIKMSELLLCMKSFASPCHIAALFAFVSNYSYFPNRS